ncbi:MAG: hypothetical protein ACM3TR_20475 [Caulobacteraceae bacterium]
MKTKILVAILLLVVVFTVYNIISHPISAKSIETLCNFNLEDVTSMTIFHWGETKLITDKSEIQRFIGAIDSAYHRNLLRDNFMFMHTGGVGGDWNVILTTDKKDIKIGIGSNQVLYKNYIYTSDEGFSINVIEDIWNLNGD